VQRSYRYNPNQPRVPAGQPGGGQWTDDGYGQDTILQSGAADGRYGRETILQPPPPADKTNRRNTLGQLAFASPLRGALRRKPLSIAPQEGVEVERPKEAPEPAFEKAPETARQMSAARRRDNMDHCVPLYVRCVGLHGNLQPLINGKRCMDCLDMCTTQGYWPFHYCPLRPF
jgi:hypothetical protein